MSVVVIDNQVVHYEQFGHGRPVLFLHGWLGSWRYWFPTMDAVAHHFRTYSFDFWGFGDSQRKVVHESIQTYSDQVIRFLDQLGIDRVTLVGHSMGGMVALKTALSYPTRISRVAAVGAPIQGESLSWMLKLTDRPLLADLFAQLPWLRRMLFRFYLGDTRDTPIAEMVEDSVKSSGASLQRAVASMLRTDLRRDLHTLRVPTLIVHGGRDEIVNPNQADLFANINSAEVVLLPHSRHFPFLDDPAMFNDLLLRFLKQDLPTRPATLRMRQPSPIA